MGVIHQAMENTFVLSALFAGLLYPLLFRTLARDTAPAEE